MADLAIHLQQAELNEGAAVVNQVEHPDWAVTISFYAAIHYIEVYAIYHGDDIQILYPNQPTAHAQRRKYVEDIGYKKRWPRLAILYSQLQLASEQARYLKGIDITAKEYFETDCGEYIKKMQAIKNILGIEKLLKKKTELKSQNDVCLRHSQCIKLG